MPLIKRSDKGSPLSIAEMDGNLDYLNNVDTYLEVDISKEQILAMASEIEILPALPANSYYTFSNVIIEYTAGATPYTFTSDWLYLWSAQVDEFPLVASSMLASANNQAVELGNSGGAILQVALSWTEAQARDMTSIDSLRLSSFNGSNPTLGDGTMKVKLWYTVRTFG